MFFGKYVRIQLIDYGFGAAHFARARALAHAYMIVEF